MNIKEIPSKIETTSGNIDLGQIHTDFSKTKYGKTLGENIRWKRYRPENIPDKEWTKLLGADANNLEHLKLTYGLTRQFIKYSSSLETEKKSELTRDEQEDLLLAAIVHDWAEAVVGDLTFDLKTQDHAIREFEELEKMIQEIYGKKDESLCSRIKIVLNNVIRDPNTKLGKIFNAIERTGYLRTGLHAWKESSKTSSKDLKMGLLWLVTNVTSGQVVPIIEYAKSYPSIALYLKENCDLINDIFANLPEEAFYKYQPGEIEEKKEKFRQARKIWQDYYSDSIKNT